MKNSNVYYFLTLLVISTFDLSLCQNDTTTPDPNATTTTPAPGGPAGVPPAPGAVTPAPGGAAPPDSITPAPKVGAVPVNGQYEVTSLTKHKICIKGDADSINYCKGNFKDEVLKNFKTELKLNITSAKCAYLKDGPPGGVTPAPGGAITPAPVGNPNATTTPAPGGDPNATTTPAPGGAVPPAPDGDGILRCALVGTFTNPKTNQVEDVRLHFFNNNGDPKAKGDAIIVIGYYGNDKVPRNVVETELTS